MALGYSGYQGYDSPDAVKRRREIEAALTGRILSNTPQNIGEGLSAIGQALAVRRMRNADAKSEAANNQTNSGIVEALLGGGTSGFPAAPAGAGASPSAADYADTRVKSASGDSADSIRQGLISRGMSPQVADAFVMNFQDESGLNPGINEQAPTVPGSRGGYGLAQWTGPRRRALEAYAAQQGKPVSDTNTQLDFLMSELNGPEKAAWAKIQGADTTGGAAAAIVNNFLRPAESHRAARESRYLANTNPIQVASNDPTSGMGVPFDASQPYNAAADARAANGAQDAIAQALMGGQQQAPALPPPQAIQDRPVAQPSQDLSQIPVMAGGTAGALPPGQAQRGLNPAIIQALSNPAASEQTQKIAAMLLGQQQKQNDPAAQLDMRYKQAQIDALTNKQGQEPDSVRALRIRAQAAGLQPGTKAYQDFMVSGGKGPLVTVNNGGNSSKFVEASDTAAAKRMDEIVQAGQTAPQTMADMQQLIDLGAQIGTGKAAQAKAILGPYAQSLGINIEGLDDIQAYDAITSRLAPQMRAVGSGSSSDRDVSMFLKSLPSLGNAQGGNEIIANTMKAVAQNKMNAAEIASKAQRGEISWQDADKQIRELPNPYDLFKKFQADTQAKKKTVIDGYTIEEVQ